MKKFLTTYKQSLILLAAIIVGTIAGLIFGERITFLKPLGDLFSWRTWRMLKVTFSKDAASQHSNCRAPHLPQSTPVGSSMEPRLGTHALSLTAHRPAFCQQGE